MNIGIDIDGVILDSEKVFRTVADLYNTIELNDRAIRAYDEPRVQEKYNWTDEEIQEFADKYFIECSKISNFMPCVKEKIDVMIDDNYMNCLEIAEKNIKTLYFRDAGIKEIKNNPHITEVHNWGEIYKYIHMYNNEINS